MEYLVYTRDPDLKYYAGFDGFKPSHSSKGDAPRMSSEMADKVLSQLATLGFKGYKKCSTSEDMRKKDRESTS